MTTEQAIQDVAMIARNGIDRVIELERQICSSTVPKNEREWWAHHEIEKLRDRLAVETLALIETLARAELAEQEAAALRADAERYRKWRHEFREGSCGLWNALCEANSDAEHDAAIDAVIDAARGESQ